MLLSGSRNLKVLIKSRKGRKQNAHRVKSTILFTITANGETHCLLLLMTDTFFLFELYSSDHFVTTQNKIFRNYPYLYEFIFSIVNWARD